MNDNPLRSSIGWAALALAALFTAGPGAYLHRLHSKFKSTASELARAAAGLEQTLSATENAARELSAVHEDVVAARKEFMDAALDIARFHAGQLNSYGLGAGHPEVVQARLKVAKLEK